MSHVVNALADHAGAVVAGTTSSLGALAFAAGQVPLPPGVPPELAWAAITFGPPLAWAGVRLVGLAAAYVRERRRQHDARKQMLTDAGRSVDDPEVVRHLDASDRFAAWEAVLGPRKDDSGGE